MNLGRLAPTKQEVAGNSNQSGCPNTHSGHFVGPDVTLVPIVIFSLRAAGRQGNNQTSQQNEFFQGSSAKTITLYRAIQEPNRRLLEFFHSVLTLYIQQDTDTYQDA